MARTIRGGLCYHVINRGNARATVFHNATDYQYFLQLVGRAQERLRMEIFAACVMPNHFHLVLRPNGDGDLGRWMHWLLTSHVRKHHYRYGTIGRIWQGRYKAFPVQTDDYLLTVMRYVERNALRANLVSRAEDWAWGSLNWRMVSSKAVDIDNPPFALPGDWLNYVNRPEHPHELEAIRTSVNRCTPLGAMGWKDEITNLLK